MDDPSISIIFFSTKKGENDLAEKKKRPGLETGSAVLRHLGLWLDSFFFFSFLYIFLIFFSVLSFDGVFCLDFFYFLILSFNI
jgi:hypothetical protein